MEIKDCLTLVQILVTLGIGVAAWSISRQQYKINKIKMMHDASSERYGVYLAFSEYVKSAYSSGWKVQEDVYREFLTGIAKSRFLFKPDVEVYLDSVHDAVVDCAHYTPEGEGAEFSAAEIAEKKKWLRQQLSESREIFSPYLRIDIMHDEQANDCKCRFCQFLRNVLTKIVRVWESKQGQ